MSPRAGVAEWIWVDADFRRVRGETCQAQGRIQRVGRLCVSLASGHSRPRAPGKHLCFNPDFPPFSHTVNPAQGQDETASGLRKPTTVESGRWGRERGGWREPKPQ